MISNFFSAVRFLTILPVPKGKGESDLARATIFFPFVGFLIALFSLLVVEILSFDLHARIQALALVTLPILLTGGIHMDGLADFCDGFFGAKNKEDILEIMRDSRIGAWAALGLILIFVWKWELLSALGRRAEAFIFALTASRWSQVVLAYFLDYANPKGGLGQLVAKKIKVSELVGATGFVLLAVLFTGAGGILCLIALLPFLAGIGFLFQKRVGGVTGDLLGAASEMTEGFVLLVFFLIQMGSLR